VQIDHDVALRRIDSDWSLSAARDVPGHSTVADRGRPFRRRRSLGAIIAVIAIAAIAAPAALAAAGADVPQAVQWDGRVFTNADDLAQWLSARGADYERWAELHPNAADILEGVAQPPAAETPIVDTAEDSVSRLVALVLLAVALSFLLLASLPRTVFARAHAAAAWEKRIELAAVGVAVAVGLAIVSLL
jgi:hypothetical protein